MPQSEAPSLAKRADAERNRGKILAAARAAFADAGAEVSMAEISRRAGVGMATLYRNFPGRQQLLEALYTDEVDALCEAAVTLAARTPGELFTAWLHRFFVFLNSKHPVASELLKQPDDNKPLMSANRERVLAVARPLLAAAQRSGEVRGNVTLEQVLDMVAAIASINGGPGYVDPILEAALDGLRLRVADQA